MNVNGTFDLEAAPGGKLSGTVEAPPSKSYTQRAIILGAMDGEVEILNPLRCEDTFNAVKVLKRLGADIRDDGHSLAVRGFNGKPSAGGVVNAGENGTLLRFALAILSLSAGETTVEGEKSLRKRPNSAIVGALRSLGVEITGEGKLHTVPLRVKGRGGFKGGEADIDGKTTSQAVSALLAIAPFAETDVLIRVRNGLVSRPYVDITADVLGMAGVKVINENYEVFRVRSGQDFRMKGKLEIGGDYSSAAFLMASAVLTESDIAITGLIPDCQGDRKIIDILNRMGAGIKTEKSGLVIKGPRELEGADIDCANTPDLAPVLTVLGCFAKGRTRIYNVPHLIYKETDRLAQPAGELRKLGANIAPAEDGLVIENSKLSSGEVFSWGDHRVAMALAAAGLGISGGVRIKNAECIRKSYPGFVKDMKLLGAALRVRPDFPRKNFLCA